MTIKTKKQVPKLVRRTVLTAAMCFALAMTALAADTITGGTILTNLREIWTDGWETQYTTTDDNGNEIGLSLMSTPNITEEDGRLVLHAAGEDIDITDELSVSGVYHYERSTEKRTVTVDVTGTVEHWSAAVTIDSIDDGESLVDYEFSSEDELDNMDVSIESGIIGVTDETDADGVSNTTTVTVTADEVSSDMEN